MLNKSISVIFFLLYIFEGDAVYIAILQLARKRGCPEVRNHFTIKLSSPTSSHRKLTAQNEDDFNERQDVGV